MEKNRAVACGDRLFFLNRHFPESVQGFNDGHFPEFPPLLFDRLGDLLPILLGHPKASGDKLLFFSCPFVFLFVP